MNTTAILALIRNDIRLFLTDRRAVIVGVLIPICIAAFFGYVFGGVGKGQEVGKLPIAVVDEDQSNVTRAIAADLAADKFLQVTTLTREVARAQVQKGTQNAAAVFPQGLWPAERRCTVQQPQQAAHRAAGGSQPGHQRAAHPGIAGAVFDEGHFEGGVQRRHWAEVHR